MPIRVLAPEVSSKIAAGEVVERPASVVKELVENAVDAGATEVAVEITGGGIESIRVTDNGKGIPADEMELALHRFATSKVSRIEDLDAIATLGFRGEALASIAAVAEVSLASRPPDAQSGSRLEAREGVVGRVHPHGVAVGTTVTVRHLFRDFPARRKFLRSPAAEAGRIQGMVSRLALAYPEVRWQLVADGKEALATGGSGDLREAFGEVYDAEMARQMLALEPQPSSPTLGVEGRGLGVVVTGLIGPPSVTRANRSYITFFVNRRWVQSRTLGFALEQAYHGFLQEHRYPVAVVNVAVPPDQVDVNVHPAKSEVRFRYEDRVFAAVQQAVRRTLTQHAPVPEATDRIQAPNPILQTPGSGGLGMGSGETPRPMGVAAFWPTEMLDKASQPSAPSQPAMPAHHDAPSVEHAALRAAQPTPPHTPKGALPVLRVLGQVQNTYVVAEGPDGMYLVDQHAAHERVLFERVRALARDRAPEAQALLEPVVLELDARLQELVDGRLELLASMGFALEQFGATAYLLRGVPGVMGGGGDPRQGFVDVLDLMADGGGFESWEERAAYSVACHSAIRAGKVLTMQEMAELARLLEACEQPHTCPHGRPTMVHMSASHLEREFGRR